MLLVTLGAMGDRLEQLRVHPHQPCQVFGIDTIVLAPVLVDQTELA